MMIGSHVKRQLSAFCNHELGAEESTRVREHLLACAKCRIEFERISLGSRLAANLERLEAPDTIWNNLEGQLDAIPASNSTRRFGFASRSGWPNGMLLATAAAILVVASATALFFATRTGHNGWKVDRLSGAPRIGAESVASNGVLRVGEWIETDSKSRARLHPGNIGEVEIEPDSRLQLLKSQTNEYRLALARGEVKARISAPPRLFFVNTPSATAVDLGCAYTLQVDDSGAGRIEVTAGLVEFVSDGRTSTIPADAACDTQPGSGPGTPYFEDASDEFKAALKGFDSIESTRPDRLSFLNTVLADARKRDSLTLWHLLSRVDGAERQLVFDRLAQLVPPPSGVTRDGIMRMDSAMLDSWFLETEPAWFE